MVGGFNPSEKYEFVSWDDEIPNIWKVIKLMFQTTNQILCTSNILKPPSEEEIRHIGFPEGKVHTSNFATPWNGRIPAAARVGQPRTSTKKRLGQTWNILYL